MGMMGGIVLRVALLIPLAMSLIAGILSAVVVSSGTSPGAGEDMAIFKINISKLDINAGLAPESTTAKRSLEGRGLLDAFFTPAAAPAPPTAAKAATSPAGLLGGLGAPAAGAPAAGAPASGLAALTPSTGSSPLTPPTGGSALTPTSGLMPAGGSAGSGIGALLSGAASGFTKAMGGSAASGGGSSGIGSLLSSALGTGAGAGLIGQLAGGVAGPIIKQVADGLTSGLGTSQWYSLHPRTFCNGNFTDPNDPNSDVKVRSCTKPGQRPTNIREVLGLDGPLSNVTEGMALPRVLNESSELILDLIYIMDIALTALFVLAIIFSFFSVVLNFGALILPTNKWVIVLNLSTATIAGTLVTVSFIVLAVGSAIIAERINRIMGDFQINAQMGMKFLGIGVAATLLSLGSLGIWSIVFVVQFRTVIVDLFKMTFSRNRQNGARIDKMDIEIKRSPY
ncbi:hypothetical protein HIM_00846 [Hirsutella minnesotensis 3608]|nr:hypothetical protein HIM_00846 [Hirsutella minnesotensis 3608]